MERSREARRAAATMNGGGGGLPRRRARGVASLRESPEEEGGMESPEMATARLRERGMKSLDRSRERSRGGDRDHHNHHHRPVVGRSSKRRRGERLVLRDDGEDSDDDTTDDDDDEDDDSSVAVRLPPPPPPPAAHPAVTNPPSPAPPPLPIHNHHQLHQHHHQQQQQKSRFPGKPAAARAPAPWKADEMIGVPVPRKARSACTKRPSPHDAFDSSAGGGGDPAPHMKRTDSASPSRTSPASASQISPSSSNSSVRKKMKPMAGAGKQPQQQPQRPSQSPSPAPTSKPAMFIPEEIEVAEVLFGLTRQFQSNKEENHRLELKETAPQSDAKPNPPPMPSGGTAPKRRLRRPLSVEDESSTSPSCSAPLPGGSASSVAKAESVAAVKPEEKPAPEPSSAENAAPQAGPARMEAPREEERREKNPISDPKLSAGGESREAPAPPSNASSKISDSSAGGSREHRPTIDLMAPPERDGLCDFDMDQKSLGPEIDTAPKASSSDKKQEEQPKANQAVESDKHPNKDRILDLQLDLDKPEKDGIAGAGGSRQAPKPAPQQQQQQPPPPPTTTTKATPKAAETRMEKAAASATFPMPMTLGSWPGGFPPFGYLGQVPPFPGAAVMPMDAGNPGSSNAMLQPPPPPVFLPPPPRPKRCATHCYIAQNIRYHHQQLAKMNPFAAAAAAAAPLFSAAAKAYNPNGMPQQDAAAAAAAAALFTGVRNPAGLPDGKGAPVMAAFLGNLAKENRPSASSNPMESAQMKQVMLQQPPQSGSAPPSMLPGPAFFFPLNQQHVAAAAAAAAANRTCAAKPSNPSAAVPSSTASNPSATSSGVTGPAAAAMNLSFAGMPPADAQYVAILHNGNAYPYPVPAHAGGPQPYRGPPGPAQAIPFFGGPFYSSQMLHASQLHHHHQQQQNASVVSGSASSQKHPPPQFPGGSTNPAPAAAGHVLTGSNHRPNLMPHRSGQHGGDKGSADVPPSADGRCSQAQKMPNGHGFSMPMLPQNFALMSAPAAGKAGLGSGSSTGEKQPQSQSTKTELATSQPFAMPFAAFNSSQHPISLNESQISSILGASLNPARSSGAATPATTASGPTAGAVPNPQHQLQHQHHHHHQQQQLAQQLQVQKQQQQLLAAKASARNANSTAKFPQTPISFPQALIQGGSAGGGNGSPGPASPQWRNPTARSPAPAVSPSVASPAAKNNHVLQQQARVPQTQISFSVNPMAPASAAATLASGAKNPASSSPPSAAAVGVGTVANPITKSSSGGTQASATAKSGSSMTTAPSLPQQQPSILKSSAASNGNAPSSSSSTKPPPHQEPQQQQHPQMKHQPFAQNSYFYNPYFQDVQSQFKAGAPSAVMSGYHRKQLQQQHKQPVNAVLPDDGKAQPVAAPGAANNMKGMAPPALLHAAHLAMTAQSGPGALQPLVPASLPYLSMPPMPVKPAATADQKPAAAD